MTVDADPTTTQAERAVARPQVIRRPRGGMFAALVERNYRIYVAGSFVSNIGTWMQRVAQDWLVLELSGGSALAVGITTGLQFLPMLLLSPYAGVIADRFNKRQILKITQSWLALWAAVLGVLAITGVATTEQVYVIAFAFGLGTAFDNPARQSFVSEVAGLVIAQVGSGWAILSNAISYLAFIIALVIIDGRLLHPAPQSPRAKRQLREGLAYVHRRTDILLVMCVMFFVGTFGLNFQMTTALMAQQQFHLNAEAYGILGTLLAVGSLAGALIAARRRSRPRPQFVVGMAVAFGLVEIATGLAPSYQAYGAALPIMGFVTLLTMTAGNASIQLGVDPRLRGRVMALYIMLLMGGTPIGAPILGWLGEAMGPRWTLIGGGAVTVLGVLASVLMLRGRLRSGES